MPIYDRHQSNLSHYFRNLYHVIKFIAESQLDEKQKKRFASLARAQVSTHELTLLYYNCLADYGREKFKPLVEKYTLLESIDHELLIDSTPALADYAASAFGDRPRKLCW